VSGTSCGEVRVAEGGMWSEAIDEWDDDREILFSLGPKSKKKKKKKKKDK
jgi:hypothetical protein